MPFIVIEVALVGNALMRMLVMVPLLGSVAPKVAAGTVTLVVPPGLTCDAAVSTDGTGGCSIPKFTPVKVPPLKTNVLVIPFTVPSPAVVVPSPVLTHPAGKATAGAGEPIVPVVVLILTL